MADEGENENEGSDSETEIDVEEYEKRRDLLVRRVILCEIQMAKMKTTARDVKNRNVSTLCQNTI